MNPEQLSHELREGAGDFLEERRGIIALSLAAIGCMGLIVLYQTGIIKHLPEPDIPGLDADKVDASQEAYSYFETPDAAIGLGSYAVTLGLAAMGGKNRATSQPWIPLALAAKTTLDAARALKLTYNQFQSVRQAQSSLHVVPDRSRSDDRQYGSVPSRSHGRSAQSRIPAALIRCLLA